MFALTIDLLAGRYVATAYNDRDRVEWPPHPARVFSALVATWAEGEPSSGDGEAELQVLRWLERQSAPDILASAQALAGLRDVLPVFVPVNDVGVVSAPDREKIDDAEAVLAVATDSKERAKAERDVKKLNEKLLTDTAKAVAAPTKVNKGDGAAAERLFADRRPRQPRTFPSASPDCSTVGFVWNEATLPEELLPAMTRLLSRLVRLGHSSTLVHGAIAANVASLVPRTTRYCRDDENGELVIRWVAAGQVEQLGRAFAQHREVDPRVLPARFIRYREGDARPQPRHDHSIFDNEFIVLARIGGPRLPNTSVVGVARQLRSALMSAADQPVHEMLSGHQTDGGASDAPHLAVVPLPVVTGPHPDGALIGVGLLLPRSCDAPARAAVMRAIGGLQRSSAKDGGYEDTISLKLGQAGVLELQQIVWGEDRRSTLKPWTWTHASTRWASATPVALDRNPGDLHDADPARRQKSFGEAKASIFEAVQRIGLPPPVEVDVLRSCVLPGTAKPITYPRFPIDVKRQQRVLVHVRLVFARPVQGPVLLGAGRFQGLGLCLPVDRRGANDFGVSQ